MADLETRRRERAAGEHQLVHEIAALEDSCVDTSVVLQDPKFVPRAFRLGRCLEEPERCPACFVHGEKAPKPHQGLYPSLSTVGCLRCWSHRGCTCSDVSLPTCASTLPSASKLWRANALGKKVGLLRSNRRPPDLRPSAHVSASAADNRPPLVFMQRGCPESLSAKRLWETFPDMTTQSYALGHVSKRASQAKHLVPIL